MTARTFFTLVSPLQQAVINFNASGDTSIIVGTTGKKIKVYRMKLVIFAAVTLTVKSGASTTLDVLPFASSGSMVLDFTGLDMPPWYTTVAGDNLVINCSGGVAIGGNVDYLIS